MPTMILAILVIGPRSSAIDHPICGHRLQPQVVTSRNKGLRREGYVGWCLVSAEVLIECIKSEQPAKTGFIIN